MSTMRRSQKGGKGEEKKRKGLPQHTAETTSLDLRSNRRRSGPLCGHGKGTKKEGRREGRKEGLPQHTAETTSRSAFRSEKEWPAWSPYVGNRREGGREGDREACNVPRSIAETRSQSAFRSGRGWLAWLPCEKRRIARGSCGSGWRSTCRRPGGVPEGGREKGREEIFSNVLTSS